MEQNLIIPAADGYPLGAMLYLPPAAPKRIVIINCATGVKAAYYARYGRFLAAHGNVAVAYDYRGIGTSRPASMRRFKATKYDWGAQDFEGVLRWASAQYPNSEIAVVGHSIGGVVPGFAASNTRISRMMTVGAQYAFWKDYAPTARLGLFWKWHIVMPLATLMFGYFPGRRLDWIEDLPAGVAFEWAFRRATLNNAPSVQSMSAEMQRSASRQSTATEHFSAIHAPILAYGTTDDPFGTPAALRRLHQYYSGSTVRYVFVSPAEVNTDSIGHFGFFHDRFQKTLWAESLAWLDAGEVLRSPAAA